jgi:hypothetical protein
MGTTIFVQSVIYPRSRARAESLYQKQGGWQEIKTICKAFEWDKVPWEDPSEQHGIRTSANTSRYYLLLVVARALDKGVKGDYKRFPHLLEYLNYMNGSLIYMPIELPHPVHLQCECGLDYTYPLMIGSAPCLSDEVDELEPLVSQIVAEKGAETTVMEYHNLAGHRWSGVYDLCRVLQTATKDSQELKLPICISG